MNIRIDEGIAPLELVVMADAIRARIEYRDGEITITRRPPTTVTLRHYNRVLEQARAAAVTP